MNASSATDLRNHCFLISLYPLHWMRVLLVGLRQQGMSYFKISYLGCGIQKNTAAAVGKIT
jgi:hypothetical protein